jgi:hypothetical protein
MNGQVAPLWSHLGPVPSVLIWHVDKPIARFSARGAVRSQGAAFRCSADAPTSIPGHSKTLARFACSWERAGAKFWESQAYVVFSF